MVKLINFKLSRISLLLISFALLCFLIACGGSKDTDTGTNTDTNTGVASLLIAASPTSIKTNNVTTSTITITALNSSLTTVSDVSISVSTDTGVLAGAEGLVTDSSGKATVTFSSGTDLAGQFNRTATITATTGSISAQVPVQITGSTISMTSSGTTVSDDGAATATVTATVKNASGVAVEGANVDFTTSSSGGAVSFSPASGTTDTNGQVTTTITGTSAGSVSVIASALGVSTSQSFTVSAAAETFAIDAQWLNGGSIANNTFTAMTNLDSLEIEVNAPHATTVMFVTTIGVWDGGSSTYVPKAVSGGKATATLTSATQAGVAGVQVYDVSHTSDSDTLRVGITSGYPAARISLQAVPSIVPKSVGTTTGTATLRATVVDTYGTAVGNAPVAFSIINPTGGGETISPVVSFTSTTATASLGAGEAISTFSAGTLSSGQSSASVQVRASVIGTSVQTEPIGVDLTPSGNDASIVIGGTAGSIAFGQATTLSEDSSKANYILPMSVLVADSNGNAVAGAVVSLSAWPIAWSTGTICTYDEDNDAANIGTFFNEDVNENLVLDSGEDGVRRFFYTNTLATNSGVTSKIDGQLQPPGAAAGLLPATVTTDTNGVASFNLVYAKNYSIWTVVRIRASTFLQDSNSNISSQIIFRLRPLIGDVRPNCLIPDSPYLF